MRVTVIGGPWWFAIVKLERIGRTTIYRLKNGKKKSYKSPTMPFSFEHRKPKFRWSVCHGILCLSEFTALQCTMAATRNTQQQQTECRRASEAPTVHSIISRVRFDVIHDQTTHTQITKEMASQTIIHLLSKLRMLCSSLTRDACVYLAYVCNVPPLSSSQLNAISTGCFVLSVPS